MEKLTQHLGLVALEIKIALSPTNRYYAAQHYGREVTDEEAVQYFFEWIMNQERTLALSPLNLWYAGERCGHEPNDEEAVQYFWQCGAARRFEESVIQGKAAA